MPYLKNNNNNNKNLNITKEKMCKTGVTKLQARDTEPVDVKCTFELMKSFKPLTQGAVPFNLQ